MANAAHAEYENFLAKQKKEREEEEAKRKAEEERERLLIIAKKDKERKSELMKIQSKETEMARLKQLAEVV